LDRSLEDGTSFSTSAPLICNSRLIALEQLVNGGYFRNNRQLIVNFWWPSNSQLFRVIRFMTNLEKLNLLDWHLTLTKDVPKLFRSCPKLTELRLKLLESKKLEMNEKLKNELRSGFQRLRLFELHWDIDSWSLIQEIFT
jgi:hypothetical protein